VLTALSEFMHSQNEKYALIEMGNSFGAEPGPAWHRSFSGDFFEVVGSGTSRREHHAEIATAVGAQGED
jgi:hypothetical protein